MPVRLRPGAHPDAGVEYVIWSMTARRLDDPAGGGAAVFPPGGRYEILAMETVDGRRRVYLADRGLDDRIDADALLTVLRGRTGAATEAAVMIDPI